MAELTRRKHGRHFFKTPITHSMYNQSDHNKKNANGYFDNYHRGVMGNISERGLYFESETPCRVMSTIHINIPDMVSGLKVSKVTSTSRARVMWCEKNNNREPLKYKVGIKLLD